MATDKPCDVCKEAHDEAIGPWVSFMRLGDTESAFSRADCIQGARRAEYLELAPYHEDLIAVRGTCMLCRRLQSEFDHRLE